MINQIIDPHNTSTLFCLKWIIDEGRTITTINRNKYDDGWVDVGELISLRELLKRLKNEYSTKH